MFGSEQTNEEETKEKEEESDPQTKPKESAVHALRLAVLISIFRLS